MPVQSAGKQVIPTAQKELSSGSSRHSFFTKLFWKYKYIWKHSNFVHLHLHSQYSLLDGAIKLNELINRAKEFKMPAVAMTDHGNMFGAVEFYSKAMAAGIKPILGCEVYVAPGFQVY